MMKDVIVALDFKNRKETMAFLEGFKEGIYVKIGMELFYSEGPEIVREIRKMGHKVFLDLKLHDIPNTVKSAMKSILRLDADMVNLHASGGSVMMEEAMNACREEGKKPLVIAVTQLTSTTEELMQSELLIDRSLTETVLSYAENAKKAGLSGVVCSALEVPVIKEHLGEGFITVTPGIRPLDSAAGDQKRIVTPARARELGSDYIVVGRPITRAEDPEKAYKEIKKEFLGV
jgi:orotidine-5'-phosphate decarboxylase